MKPFSTISASNSNAHALTGQPISKSECRWPFIQANTLILSD